MNTPVSKILRLSLLLGLAAALAGCQKKEAPVETSSSGPAPAIVSAEKNSFEEVTSKLDKGGNLYVYLSAEQVLSKLSQSLDQVSNTIVSLPFAAGPGQEGFARGMGILSSLVKESGVESISGFGASSIAREKGFYYSKFIVHHYAGQNDGLIWSLFGKQAHPLKELDMLPETTVFASYADLDAPGIWKAITANLARLHMAEVDKQIEALPGQFKEQTGMSLQEALGSLKDGGYGVILTLDDTKTFSVPLLSKSSDIPEFGVALYAKVKDSKIFDRLDQAVTNASVKVNKPGLKSRTFKLSILLPDEVTPTFAQAGDYLFLTSSEGTLNDILDTQAGKKPGFKSTPEFKRLSQGVPLEGNNFSLVSEKLGITVDKLVQGTVSNGLVAALGGQGELLKSMLASTNHASGFSVGANGPQGWEIVANGNRSPTAMFVPAAAAAGGVVAAVALPAIAKVKEMTQPAQAAPKAKP